MSRRLQAMDQKQRAETVARVLDAEAEKLASEFGIDRERLRTILEQGLQTCAGDPLQRGVSDCWGEDLPDHFVERVLRQNVLAGGPSLDLALRYMGPDSALQLFEQEDLRQLNQREDAAHHLLLNEELRADLIALDELATQIEEFADHVERHRVDLVNTGWGDPDGPDHWIAFQLENHLPTKDPAGIGTRYKLDGKVISEEELRAVTGAETAGPVTFESYYLWAKDSELDEDDETGTSVPRAYEDAPLSHFLDASDGERLESLRPPFLALKIAVLRRLARSLRARNATNLWQDCLELITNSLSASDAEFLLAMDRGANGWDVLTGAFADDTAEWDGSPGGLTALFEVIGHCEEELRVGWFWRTQAAMPAGIHDRGVWNLYMVPAAERPAFDAAIDMFLTGGAKNERFWADYRTRVNVALETKFKERVVFEVWVPRRVLGTFEPVVRSFIDFQRTHAEAIGSIAPLSFGTGAVLPAPPVESRTIRAAGGVRFITLDGVDAVLPDTKGLKYLSFLLLHPRKDFHVLELVRHVDQVGAASPAIQAGAFDDLTVSFTNLDEGQGVGATLDRQAKAELHQRARKLASDLSEAREVGDESRIEQILHELEWISEELNKSQGLGGRDRPVNSNAERARSKVTKQINEAIKQIAKQHLDLGQHLQSVRTGTMCGYHPPRGQLPWKLVESESRTSL